MKAQKKKMILIPVILAVILAVIIIVGVLIWKNATNKDTKQEEENTVTEKYVEVLEDGTKLNKSSKLHETKKLDGLEIADIQLKHQNGLSVLIATVTNKTNQDLELTPVEITLYDDKNNELEKIDGLISPIKAGESVQLNMGVSADYANAYDFKIVKK